MTNDKGKKLQWYNRKWEEENLVTHYYLIKQTHTHYKYNAAHNTPIFLAQILLQIAITFVLSKEKYKCILIGFSIDKVKQAAHVLHKHTESWVT